MFVTKGRDYLVPVCMCSS